MIESMTEDTCKQVDEEIEDLRKEMELFHHEKERVRAIVGKIGGMPNFNTKILNIAFTVFILACLVVSFVGTQHLQFLSMELAIAALSLKLLYLVHHHGKISHFQLWILSSLEWRLDEILREIKLLKEKDEPKSG